MKSPAPGLAESVAIQARAKAYTFAREGCNSKHDRASSPALPWKARQRRSVESLRGGMPGQRQSPGIPLGDPRCRTPQNL